MERQPEETFEQLIGARWREEDFVKKVADGYQANLFEEYAKGVDALEGVEKQVLQTQPQDVGNVGTIGAVHIV